ncbi:MAG: antitoxin VbhA family protein [Clostridia bacterium]|nr:antitoxin VbhA family protein [Clostridia bacterium]
MAPVTIDRAIENAAASSKMEGIIIDENMKSLIKKVIEGNLSIEEAFSLINNNISGE